MTKGGYKKSLRHFAQAIESLDFNKQIAASKWLEGVIAGRALTSEEREKIVEAVNKYVENIKEDEYQCAVNALLEYLRKSQTLHSPEERESTQLSQIAGD